MSAPFELASGPGEASKVTIYPVQNRQPVACETFWCVLGTFGTRCYQGNIYRAYGVFVGEKLLLSGRRDITPFSSSSFKTAPHYPNPPQQ